MTDIVTSTLTEIPTFTAGVDQRYLIEPLGGPQDPRSYLDRFPDEIYRKALESHLVRLIYTLLGPAGIGWLQKNTLEARLLFENHGLEIFDLDSFYGNPLKFGRILEEIYDEDPTGLLSKENWDKIKAKDAQYRNRAVDYLNGVRMGNTPEGMRLIAKSGLGHDAEIIENYRYLYDIHSDDPIGLTSYGSTTSTEEMVVLPRRTISRSEIQTITIVGFPTTGSFTLLFGQYTSTPINHNASPQAVEAALVSIPTIGVGQIHVTGGPGPLNPWSVLFTGTLSARDVPELIVNTSSLDAGSVEITTAVGGIESTDEIVNIAPRDRYHLQVALDFIKPVTTIPTMADATGIRTRQHWGSVFASSEFRQVLRCVTGAQTIQWPPVDGISWVEAGVEKEAPRVVNDIQYHYVGYHNVSVVYAYTDVALGDVNYLTDVSTVAQYPSEHIGRFNPDVMTAIPLLSEFTDDSEVHSADKVMADYPEPIVTTSVADKTVESPTLLINGIYPVSYFNLPGVPQVKYRDEQFWASLARTQTEVLELDLGMPQAVNYVSFEVLKSPLAIKFDYDGLDLAPTRNWIEVTPVEPATFPSGVTYMPNEQNPWQLLEFSFTNAIGQMIYSRYIRLTFERVFDELSPFLSDGITQRPWNVVVKNLRIGRSVTE